MISQAHLVTALDNTQYWGIRNCVNKTENGTQRRCYLYLHIDINIFYVRAARYFGIMYGNARQEAHFFCYLSRRVLGVVSGIIRKALPIHHTSFMEGGRSERTM